MISLEVDAGVARLSLHSPPVNAIGTRWLEAFSRHLDDLADRDDWRVLHIRSQLRTFCAGADLQEMRQSLASGDGIEAMVAMATSMQRLFARLESLPQVTLAEIGGAALGGGLELALSCDLRIAGRQARLGLPEARLGLVPGAGGTQRLTRLAGSGIASRLILGAEIIDGEHAATLSLVQWCVPDQELAARAAEIAMHIADHPAAALASCKSCIAAASDSTRDGFQEELVASRRLYLNPDSRARIEAFLARRGNSDRGED